MHLAEQGPSEAVLSKLLAADFDPDDYDKLMAGAFNDDYYEVCLCNSCYTQSVIILVVD